MVGLLEPVLNHLSKELLQQVTEGLIYAVLKPKEQCEEECDGNWISYSDTIQHFFIDPMPLYA